MFATQGSGCYPVVMEKARCLERGDMVVNSKPYSQLERRTRAQCPSRVVRQYLSASATTDEGLVCLTVFIATPSLRHRRDGYRTALQIVTT